MEMQRVVNGKWAPCINFCLTCNVHEAAYHMYLCKQEYIIEREKRISNASMLCVECMRIPKICQLLAI